MTRKTFQLTLVLTIATFVSAAIAACGSGEQAEDPITELPTAAPTATFVTIKVTPKTNQPPTPTPTPEGTPSTRGAAREFPELLKTDQNLTVGPLMSTWQSYLDDSVIIFGNNTWDLCTAGRGLAIGELMNGNLVWTLALPREGMLGNEIVLTAWNPDTERFGAFVAGYADDSPYLKLINNYNNYDTTVQFVYDGASFNFQAYELTNCLNL